MRAALWRRTVFLVEEIHTNVGTTNVQHVLRYAVPVFKSWHPNPSVICQDSSSRLPPSLPDTTSPLCLVFWLSVSSVYLSVWLVRVGALCVCVCAGHGPAAGERRPPASPPGGVLGLRQGGRARLHRRLLGVHHRHAGAAFRGGTFVPARREQAGLGTRSPLASRAWCTLGQ